MRYFVDALAKAIWRLWASLSILWTLAMAVVLVGTIANRAPSADAAPPADPDYKAIAAHPTHEGVMSGEPDFQAVANLPPDQRRDALRPWLQSIGGIRNATPEAAQQVASILYPDYTPEQVQRKAATMQQNAANWVRWRERAMASDALTDSEKWQALAQQAQDEGGDPMQLKAARRVIFGGRETHDQSTAAVAEYLSPNVGRLQVRDAVGARAARYERDRAAARQVAGGAALAAQCHHRRGWECAVHRHQR